VLEENLSTITFKVLYHDLGELMLGQARGFHEDSPLSSGAHVSNHLTILRLSLVDPCMTATFHVRQSARTPARSRSAIATGWYATARGDFSTVESASRNNNNRADLSFGKA
jgi:hypothetical protein